MKNIDEAQLLKTKEEKYVRLMGNVAVAILQYNPLRFCPKNSAMAITPPFHTSQEDITMTGPDIMDRVPLMRHVPHIFYLPQVHMCLESLCHLTSHSGCLLNFLILYKRFQCAAHRQFPHRVSPAVLSMLAGCRTSLCSEQMA
ncbi:unnamed protein product [Peronospora belbahrii]|uniref:Uncharacterized protein n=1 Tax=Peronospora belbahrii TaxID=622444 RepID=A0AAU9LAF3_9STRA|nr:unnamed protein product [Peronospora belbahrii]